MSDRDENVAEQLLYWEKELEQTTKDLDHFIAGFKEEIEKLRKEGRPELAAELEREVKEIERKRTRR